MPSAALTLMRWCQAVEAEASVERLMNSLQSLFWPEWVSPVNAITDWGGPLGWLIAIQLVFYLVGIRQGVFIGLLAVLTLLLNSWLKSLLFLPRPYMLDPGIAVHQPTAGLGMPSGHAQGAAAVWLGVAGFARRRLTWRFLAALLVVAVCLSRVILGVHSINQVLVGAGLGLAGLWLAQRLRQPLVAWFASQPRGVAFAAFLALGASASLLTVGIDELRAGHSVPEQWQENFAQASQLDDVGVSQQNLDYQDVEPASELTLAALLGTNSAFALISASLGLVLVAWVQQCRPVGLAGRGAKGLCILVGCLVTALFWWLAAVSDWISSPLALLLPLVYPLVCGYVPVALTQLSLGRHQK